MTDYTEVSDALRAFGFIHEYTGGGCTAYCKGEDGSYIWYITKHDDASAPTRMSDPIDVGQYRLDTGDLVGEMHHFASVSQYVASHWPINPSEVAK